MDPEIPLDEFLAYDTVLRKLDNARNDNGPISRNMLARHIILVATEAMKKVLRIVENKAEWKMNAFLAEAEEEDIDPIFLQRRVAKAIGDLEVILSTLSHLFIPIEVQNGTFPYVRTRYSQIGEFPAGK